MKRETLQKLSELEQAISDVVCQYEQSVETIDLTDRTLTVVFDKDGSDLKETNTRKKEAKQ